MSTDNNIKDTFSQIYDTYIDKIYRFVFFKVNSQEVAEDLCSETFIRGWQSFQEKKEIENPRAFLYQIARNLIVDYYRDKAKTQMVSADSLPIIDPKSDLEAETIKKSDLETIKAGLSGLKDDYREVLTWHYIEDLPVPEIAVLLGKSEGATRVLLHRALKSLKNWLSDSQTDTA
jgi:RNA polymerase sigma-70 factor (ECF subfamily)